MNRRAFLKFLAAGSAVLGAGAEIDYERLLWVPGQQKIFLPTVEAPTPAEVDAVLAMHGVEVPRYSMLTWLEPGRSDEKITLLFDKAWRLTNGDEVLRRSSHMMAEDLRLMQEGLDTPTRDQTVAYGKRTSETERFSGKRRQ